MLLFLISKSQLCLEQCTWRPLRTNTWIASSMKIDNNTIVKCSTLGGIVTHLVEQKPQQIKTKGIGTKQFPTPFFQECDQTQKGSDPLKVSTAKYSFYICFDNLNHEQCIRFKTSTINILYIWTYLITIALLIAFQH